MKGGAHPGEFVAGDGPAVLYEFLKWLLEAGSKPLKDC